MKTGESWWSKILILQKKRADKPIRWTKVCNSSLLSLVCCSFPFCYSLLCHLSSTIIYCSPHQTSTAVSHCLYCFPSNKRIDQCHSQSLPCLTSITLMQGLLLRRGLLHRALPNLGNGGTGPTGWGGGYCCSCQ